jgi:membrane associated rhomboid family serine protease
MAPMKIAMRRLFYLAVFGLIVWGVVGDWQEVRDFDFHIDFVALICGALAAAVLGLFISFRARSKQRRAKMATAPKKSK